jgi:hypothetical protein
MKKEKVMFDEKNRMHQATAEISAISAIDILQDQLQEAGVPKNHKIREILAEAHYKLCHIQDQRRSQIKN